MARLLPALFLLLFLQASITKTWAEAEAEEDEFFKDCLASKCGGIDVRYPFRLQSSPPYCGAPGMNLSCSSEGVAAITLPQFGSCKVINIDYSLYGLTIQLGESWAQCPLRNLGSINFTNPIYDIFYGGEFLIVGCTREIRPDPTWISGPISCLGSEGRFVYAADARASMDKLPRPVCKVINSTAVQIPDHFGEGEVSINSTVLDFGPLYYSWGEILQNFIATREMGLYLSTPEFDGCRKCEVAGKRCGFSRTRNQTFCSSRHHCPSVNLIVGTSIGGFILLAFTTAVIILFYILRKTEKDREIRLRVEKFLATYSDAKPTRYTFPDVKKITKRFKDKLGQGGYGSVYKGELPNGIPVAVKMLERSKGEGEEFINEVATIGRIHHINIVRLLGFCSERSTRALIYEFMPNESLEKYIFSREAKGATKPFCMEKLLNIAIGIAQGIEYLHQGCEQRILHFDIKPHNILLDHEFNPKISDFGLAKLCSREQSIVTMTAARGTMGYIAPEMYSRNFGPVSYKSDVYSFGMLVLEMVGGRRNLDPEIGKQSEIYFPEWVYDRLVHRQDLGLALEMEGEEEEIVRKLAIVALWCIQWSPVDRPSMTRVLQMLTGDLQSLQIPPKPFVSSVDPAN